MARVTKEKTAKEAKIPVNQRPGFQRRIDRKAGDEGKEGRNTIDSAARIAQRAKLKRRAAKVIYFVNGHMPSSDDIDAAEAIGSGVVFRNALKIVPGAPLENCDAVAGAVPDDYAGVFPAAKSNHQINDEQLAEDAANGVERPNRSKFGGNNPDDVRPGTIGLTDTNTGKAVEFGSGTGAEMPGGINPRNEPADGSVTAPADRDQAAVWKSNKVEN